MFHLWLNIPVADIPTSPSVAVHPGSDKSGRSPLYGFLSRHGDKILALVPLAFLIWVVAQYAVAVPYLDQWELVPLLEKTTSEMAGMAQCHPAIPSFRPVIVT